MAFFKEGFQMVAASPVCILVILVGTIIGIIFGAIPGLSSTMALVLFLPFTYSMSTINGISLLLALYVGGMSGGLISAILLKIPGTPASLSTVWDGGPMADRGEAGRALGICVLVSFVGTIIGLVALFTLSPLLAEVALKFTPYEYFGISLFSLSIIASLAGADFINGLQSGLLGILMSMIGMAPIDAVRRFTFGTYMLDSGINTVPMLVGIFAVADIFIYSFEKKKANAAAKQFEMHGFGMSFKEFISQGWNMLRSAIVGVVVGILPGIGGNTAGVFSYTLAKNASKHPEKFGTGCVEGLVASETANNAVIGGSIVPMLTLGIPGNTVAAILLGGMTIKGVAPGPLIFDKAGGLVYGMYIAIAIATFFMLILETLGIRMFVRVLDIPKYILFPLVLVLCGIGCFGANNRMFDVSLMFIIGVFAFCMKKLKISMSPMIIGFILGSMFEENLRRTISLSKGSFKVLFKHPIAMVFIALAIIFLIYSTIKALKQRPISDEEPEE